MKLKLDRVSKNVAAADSLYESLKDEYGCDPFAIMALMACGRVVDLGLMTQEELDAEETLGATLDGVPFRMPSGRHRALEVLPVATRFSAAKELAGFCKPKLAATTFLSPDGRPMQSNVVLYVPDNGRLKQPA